MLFLLTFQALACLIMLVNTTVVGMFLPGHHLFILQWRNLCMFQWAQNLCWFHHHLTPCFFLTLDDIKFSKSPSFLDQDGDLIVTKSYSQIENFQIQLRSGEIEFNIFIWDLFYFVLGHYSLKWPQDHILLCWKLSCLPEGHYPFLFN